MLCSYHASQCGIITDVRWPRRQDEEGGHYRARDACLSTLPGLSSSLLLTHAVHFCLSCVFVDVYQLKLRGHPLKYCNPAMHLCQNIAKTPIGNGTQTRVVSLKDKTNGHPSWQFSNCSDTCIICI